MVDTNYAIQNEMHCFQIKRANYYSLKSSFLFFNELQGFSVPYLEYC